MSRPAQPVQSQHVSPPRIRIQSSYPVSFEQPRPLPIKSLEALRHAAAHSKTPSHKSGKTPRSVPSHSRSRSACLSGFGTASQDDKMATARIPRHSSLESSTKKQHYSSSSSKKSIKASSKDADWADVTDPEERRRIQNRIAQRKFREKARENKEKAERDARNQEHAGNSYRIPVSADVRGAEDDLSGLPWGGMNWGFAVSRGHEAESLRSSGRGTYVGDEPYTSPQYPMPYSPGLHQTASYGSSGGEDVYEYYDDANYVYDATVTSTFSA